MKLPTTIYAVSSGLGRAGIAVVRVSGPEAKHIVASLVLVVPNPRHASLRKLVWDGDVIDQALVLWFPGPHSATGEDLVEFHVHGSAAVLARLFSIFSTFENTVPALAGEFTRRAFDNGRLDLVEVEGLADLLDADSEGQRRLAIRQFIGESSGLVASWRDRVIEALALIEAAVDFADDDADIAAVSAGVARKVWELIADLQQALDASVGAAGVRSGLRLVIAGAPNVGKSSLFNWLVDREAAIVSPQAGTTRDVVSSGMNIAGLPVVVADTAGLRDEAQDDIERMGMKRSESEIGHADVLIWVRAEGIEETVGPGRTPDLVVCNKSDLATKDSILTRNDRDLWVSVKTGEALNELRTMLNGIITKRHEGADNAVIVRQRHRERVRNSIRYLNDFMTDAGKSTELRAEDLRRAAHELAAITGKVDVEDLLGKIFSEFCIGK